MAEPDHSDDLARRKAEAEIAKLEAEAAKARREGRGIGARVGVVVSVATVLVSLTIGGSQVWLAHLKQEDDRRLREVDLGLKTAQFVLERQETFLAVSADGQRAFVGLVVDTFPAEDARRLLRRFGRSVTQAGPAAAICSALMRLDAIADAEDLGCTGDPAPPVQVADSRPPVPAAPAPAPAAPSTDMPAAPASSAYETAQRLARQLERRAVEQQRMTDPCTGLPEPTEGQLQVFIHVADETERVALQESAGARVRIGWPVAPIDLVRVGFTRREAEVRYYFPDQCRLAAELADRLPGALDAAGIAPPPVTIRYIGINYRNLPRGRIEVWLPPRG